MHTILLDNVPVETLVPASLPMLIHGEQGSGASLYTVCLAAKWFSIGYRILFLCGYPMAEKAFADEVGKPYPEVSFYVKEKTDEFLATLQTEATEKRIVIVKNIELFDEQVIYAIKHTPNLILSGDFSNITYKEELLELPFTTEVYFSPLTGKELPFVEKFSGVVIAGDYLGITSLSSK